MGCDIHLHVEIKVKGKWKHYNHPRIERDYRLFSKMAGVRGDEEAISLPRGLPSDISFTTKFDCDYDGSNGHSHSWLSAAEASYVQEWYNKLRGVEYMHPPLFGYLFGGYINSYLQFPSDTERLFKRGFKEARIVFWFDN